MQHQTKSMFTIKYCQEILPVIGSDQLAHESALVRFSVGKPAHMAGNARFVRGTPLATRRRGMDQKSLLLQLKYVAGLTDLTDLTDVDG